MSIHTQNNQTTNFKQTLECIQEKKIFGIETTKPYILSLSSTNLLILIDLITSITELQHMERIWCEERPEWVWNSAERMAGGWRQSSVPPRAARKAEPDHPLTAASPTGTRQHRQLAESAAKIPDTKYLWTL